MNCLRRLEPCELEYLKRERLRAQGKYRLIIDDPLKQRVTCPWDFSEDPTPEASRVNTPTPAGRELGAHIARMVDVEEARLRESFPDMHPRCVDCAARAGTIPNGCEETLMDFLKSAIEGVQFNCHKGVPDGEKPSEACRGWLMLQTTNDGIESVGRKLGKFFLGVVQ